MTAAGAKAPIGAANRDSDPVYGPPVHDPREEPPPVYGPPFGGRPPSPVRQRAFLLLVGVVVLVTLLLLLLRCW